MTSLKGIFLSMDFRYLFERMSVPADRSVPELMRVLGDDPNTIARRLRKLDIIGDHSCYGCPIAQYLWPNFPGMGISVGMYTVTIGRVTTQLPDAVKMFVVGFDSGNYPFLEL